MSLSPRQVFERYAYLGAHHDADAQADLFAPDGVLELPFAPAGVTRRFAGREAIREMLHRYHARAAQSPDTVDFAGTRLAWHETTDPGTVIAEIDTRLITPDGPTELTLVQIFRVTDGEIVSLRDFWDGTRDFANWFRES
ncbi:hypothetical protein Lfu02_03590 [Longispora fulva]|uniref:Ketosteroid isomerase-like protein n=1 Tax=Longispora fulva TaxID=619741 RepID=A0A8J7GFS5_9ACTN|nr:nuclear transport factor 2 family protein [Longispora fulva]MBG6135772.1 ketosteroid isomerase-like protein [Longispora fulva]GIG55987.1 hypothetical protein Lfu02_03590 [Longispora fulva]